MSSKSEKRYGSSCECCDVMQLVQDALTEALRDHRRGRYVARQLEQLVVLTREANHVCSSVHNKRIKPYGVRQSPKPETLPLFV